MYLHSDTFTLVKSLCLQDHKTPLMVACVEKQYDFVKALIERKADVDSRDIVREFYNNFISSPLSCNTYRMDSPVSITKRP